MRLPATACATLALLTGVAHGSRQDAGALAGAKAIRVAVLTSINTHESFRLRPDDDGRFTKKQLRGWNHFMRCWHTGRQHAMNPRLAELIYDTARHFEFAPLRLYDGYRAPIVARQKGNTKSPHKRGIAADFVVEGVDNKTLRDYLFTTYDKVGVGYYPNSSFVHLDVRPKGKAFWIDYSYPGQKQSKAFYAKKTYEQLKADEAALEAATAEEHEPAPPEGSGPQGSASPGATTPKGTALETGSP